MTVQKRRIAFFLAFALGCVFSAVAPSSATAQDRTEWNDIPLSRIHPRPSKEELGSQTSLVHVTVKSSEVVPTEERGAGISEVRKQLADQIRSSGAKTVSKGARYAVAAELITYSYEAEFDGPTNWRFKSEEEMAQKPGTCRHEVDLDVAISVYEGRRKQPIRAWSLEASGRGETKTTDQSCPFETADRRKLVVEALREAMPCMQIELMNLFAPRGHIVAQQRYGERGADVFRTTIKRGTLPEPAQSFAVNRVQLSTDPAGARERIEHQIAKGSAADRPGDALWIKVKVSKALLPLLVGDVVRPIMDRGMVSRMNPFGGCDEILEPQ